MKTFYHTNEVAEAEHVTPENLDAVAAWCNGAVKGTRLPAEQREIELKVHSGEWERAVVGNWIVKESGIFTIYPDDVFQVLFGKE
jgi:hypothetical protein